MEYNHRLAELKRLILLKSGIKFMTPADCKRISIEISRELNKNVSETTIKRLFGFAVVKHTFSNFTLTTLAEYVDDENIKQTIPADREAKTNAWNTLQEKADKITSFTLKTIRNRSSIPYEMTISRRYAEHDFDNFYQGDFVFTSLISQPGYGRSTMLSHMAENLILSPNPKYIGSSLLFLQAYNFFNIEQLNLNLEDQLKKHLEVEIDEPILSYINRQQTKLGGKFIIIIDGLAELILKKEQKNQLFDSIINLICSLEGHKNIKLILSMRSTKWTRFYDRIRHSTFLKSAWFKGEYFNMNEVTNVPPFSEREVELIISKMNCQNDLKINPKLKAQLKYPFHIHLFYQLKEEDPDFNYYSNITFYELVSRFIQEKIYRSNYYTEKILFLKKIIQLTNYGRGSSFVAKDNLIQELSAFKNAYMELLSDGILMEERRFENEHPTEYVGFLHTHMFEYFLFVEILEKFHLQINAQFFEYINEQYDSNQARFQLLQWTIRFLIKTGNFENLKYLFKLRLNSFETNYLILFTAEEIKYRSKYNPGLLNIMDANHFHDVVIHKLINFDFIDSCYKEAVATLITIVTSDEHLMIYQTLLGIIDILSMDKKEVNNRIQNLDRSVTDQWMVNPYEAFDIIYSRMNSSPIKPSKLLQQIEDLKKGENSFGFEASDGLDTRQGISLILILFVNFFTGTYHSNIQIIESLAKLRPDLLTNKNSFVAFMLNIYEISNSKLDPIKKMPQIESNLANLAYKNNGSTTKYQEAILMIYNAQQMMTNKRYEEATRTAVTCLELFKKNDMILNVITCYDLLITIAQEKKDKDMVNEYKYERLLVIDEHQVAPNLF